MIYNKYNYRRSVKTLFWLGFLLLPTRGFAQGLTLGSDQQGSFLPTNASAWILLALRYIIVLALIFGAFSAFKNGYDWMYWEGNAAKAKDAQKGLSRSLIFITVFFFAAFLFRVFVPDYSVLGI